MKRKLVKYHSQFRMSLGDQPLVISAGMPRSGSTMLFNILRELMEVRHGDGLNAGWVHDFRTSDADAAWLIKLHRLSRFYRYRASSIFYTYRDVRVAAVSAHRKFGQPFDAKQIRNDLRQYRVARRAGAMAVKYEDIIADPAPHVHRIAQSLQIQADEAEICERVFALDASPGDHKYCKQTLLHQDHRTGTGDDEWREVIPLPVQKQINREFAWWLEECGYPAA